MYVARVLLVSCMVDPVAFKMHSCTIQNIFTVNLLLVYCMRVEVSRLKASL